MRPLCHALLALMIVAFDLCLATSASAQEGAQEVIPGGAPVERLPPGAHSPYDNQPGGSTIGGRPGSLRPRVPINRRPGGLATFGPGLPALPVPEAATRTIPVPNSWSILLEIKDQGPPAGLTWDQAMDRLVAASIALRAKSLDIPQAQADVLTAGMHANPVVYFDTQLIPYRPYNAVTNPGGPTQYDLNVAYPLDLSGKRQARVEVASAAQRVVEALYQDAVRQEIDRLGSAYIDALAARLAVRTIQGGLARIDEIKRRAAEEKRDPREAEALRRQIQIQRQTIALALVDAEGSWRNSQRTLSMMLNLPRDGIPRLELRGTLEDMTPPPPPVQNLVSSALANRPDLVAYRLGLQRAEADVRLSRANRLPDVYALYQPFTYQDNSPFNAPSSRAWAAGATVTVPLFDRNQGNIRRAQVNVEQSQLELQALELRVTTEVEGAYDDYLSTQLGLRQIEAEVLPDIEKTLGESLQKFQQGTLDSASYLGLRRDLDDLGRQYRELLIRHRRSMLAVNTAVGIRVFP